jgi:hypothetical protein
MQLRIRASLPTLAPGKYEIMWNSFFVSCEDSVVSTRLYGPKPEINAPGPEDRARIPASTIQNTEAEIELRWTGTEVIVRKYYSDK